MSFLKKLVTAVVVGAAVYMTGGLAAGAIGISTGIKLTTLAAYGAIMGGLGVVSEYLGKPKANKQSVNARLNLSVDPNTLGKLVYGETSLGTDVVYHEKIGDEKVFYVVAGAFHEIEEFGKLYIDDEEIQLDSSGNAMGEWEGALKVYRNIGSRTQDAFNIPISEWPESAKGRGIAHYGLLFDASTDNGKEKLANGIPSRITQVAKAAKVYDPRKDSTAGGVGLHRVDDEDTWGFSKNWALIVANYLIGHRLYGKLVYGVGVEPADIDWQQVSNMADVCDSIVDGKPKYEIGCIIDITNNHSEVIQLLESAVDGSVSKVGGKYYIWCPHDDTENVRLTITDDDIVSDQGISFSPTAGIEKLYNTARGQYVSPDNLYQLTAYPEVSEQSALDEDGKRRLISYDFSMIQDPSIAQRIAREKIRRSRFTGSVSLLMGPRYIALKPFDIVQVSVKETNNQPELFRVIGITGSVNGFAQVELIEENPSIYDTSIPIEPSLIQFSPSVYNPSQVVSPINVQAANVVVQGTDSAKDAIRLTWNDPGAFVRETEVRFRINDTATDYEHSIANFSTSIVISPVESLTEYDLQVRHVTREGVLSNWIQVIHTSGDETLNVIREGQIDDFIPGTEFGKRVRAELDSLDDLLGGVDELLERVAQDINDELANAVVRGEIREVRIENTQKIIALVNEYLDELQGETLPELNSRLAIAEDELEQLQVTILPALNNRLDTAENDLTVLNSTTIPQLQDELNIAESEIASIQGEIFSVTGSVPQTIDDVLEGISQDISEIVQRSESIRAESNERKVDIASVNSSLEQLNSVDLPALNADLVDAKADIQTLDGLFPIIETSISDDAISTPKIQANAITADKIIAGAITTDKMTANSIAGDRITANTLSADRIITNTITALQIAANAITADKITANAITSDKIQALAISAEKIAALAVSADKIAADAVTADKIQANAVTAVKILAEAITADKIAANAVVADKIAANAVTAAKVAANSISADKMVANTITAEQIAAFTITGEQIQAASVNADRLVALSITANEIAANAINADKIAANSIGADKIVANSITSNEIAANTITAANIQALSITGDEIAARSIAADKIVANSLTAQEILTGTITANEIAALTITGNKIAARSIGANKIVANSITAAEIEALAITAEKIAADAIDGKTITGATINGGEIIVTNVGSDFVRITNSTAFGVSNDLLEWFGAKVSGVTWNFTTQKPILSGMGKTNARTYTTINGDVYFGGTFQAGTISSSASTTSLQTSGEASIIFTSNGNALTVSASYSWNLTQNHQETTCPTTPPDPVRQGTLVIEELVGATWTARRSENITGTFDCIPAIIEGGETLDGIYEWSASRSFTYTANQASGTRRFRVRFFNMTGGGSIAGAASVNQSASVASTEE